jgi:hypothetical protein
MGMSKREEKYDADSYDPDQKTHTKSRPKAEDENIWGVYEVCSELTEVNKAGEVASY